MKMTLLLFCFILSHTLHAQMTLKGKIIDASTGEKITANVPYDVWYREQNSVTAVLDKNGEFLLDLNVKKPQIIFLDFAGKRLHLYAEPGKSLLLKANGRNFVNTVKFRGDLGRENTFRQQVGLTFQKLYPEQWDETVAHPAEILASIQRSQAMAIRKLDASRFKEGTFFRLTKGEIDFFAPSTIFSIMYRNDVMAVGSTPKHPEKEWFSVLKMAYEGQPISNSTAIGSYHYGVTVAYYARYLEMACRSREEYRDLTEKLFQKPYAEAIKEVRAKGRNYWEYKAINFAFEGEALENALASFIVNNLESGEITVIPEVYADFIDRFPQSVYLPYLEGANSLGDMSATIAPTIILDGKSNQYLTLDTILESHKGRVVYVDVWGSWCGPCREEFRHTSKLKKHFEGKPVDFIYIAFERSASPETAWEKTIAFYNLEGRHILGNKELESFFQNIYGGESGMVFPSYLLIDTNGQIITTHAERPSSGERLFKQIEELLK